MATRVTITPTSTEPDAPVRVAKVKLPNDRRDRAAEAAWLARAARPGIVPLVTIDEPPPTEPFTIVTEHVGSRTLRTARLGPLEAWRVIVDVAELMGELHRDGLVHGKLTADHVIIGAERVWLCSPDGSCEDPGEDLDGLARCMGDLQHQWEISGLEIPFGTQWADLAERLADTTDPSRSATRVLHSLRRLEPRRDQGTADGRSPRSRTILELLRRRTGVLALSLAIAIAIGALPLVTEGSGPPSATGPRVEVDGVIYAVGVEGDDVALLDNPCDPSTPIIALEAATQTVWAFDRIADGAIPRPIAVIPGATDVRAEWIDTDPPCTVAVARGPAGTSIIETDSNR
jgi:hypothetical protein